jgi:hypothetical protein
LKIKKSTQLRGGKRAGLAAAALVLPALGVVAGPAGTALADPGDIEIAVALSAGVVSTVGVTDVCVALYDAQNQLVRWSNDCGQTNNGYYPGYKPGNVFVSSTLSIPVGPLYHMTATVAGHPELTVMVANVQASSTGERSFIVELGTNKLTVGDSFQY